MQEEKKHSILSPSSCKRWVNCPPSALLNHQAERTTSEYAEEGTLAHAVAEEELKHRLLDPSLGREVTPVDSVPEDMREYVAEYVNYVAQLPACAVYIEHRVDLTHLHADTFGTVDAAVVTPDGALHVCDLKYGQGVRVDAKDNYQLMLYAHGLVQELESLELYQINSVVLHIIQPRLEHISVHELTINELNAWFGTEVRPAAALAVKGEGDRKAGDHCRFCAARARCRAASDHAQVELLDLFDKVEKAKSSDAYIELTNSELSQALTKFDDLSEWIKSVKQEAHAAIMRGEKVPGYMLTQSLGNRKWADEAQALKFLSKKLGKKEVTTTELLSVAQLEKKLGKQEFAELCGSLVTRPTNGPTLTKYAPKKADYAQSSADEIATLLF